MYVESDVLYSFLKETDWLKEFSENIVKKFDLITSAITIVELEIVSKRDFGEEFSNSVLENLRKIKKLKIISLNEKILEKAIRFRKENGLNIFDSIHAATAIQTKNKIISTDNMYDLIDELERIDPRDL